MKPILFNTEMTIAILEERKKETRRVIKSQPEGKLLHVTGYKCDEWWEIRETEKGEERIKIKAPFQEGDILWVRETWQYAYELDGNDQIIEDTGKYYYAADAKKDSHVFSTWLNPDGTHRDSMPWRPSIHMPKEAARIFLKVCNVYTQRLQDCSNGEIKNEGTKSRDEFAYLWDKTIKPTDIERFGWQANPLVWVIQFERIEKEEARKENSTCGQEGEYDRKQ